MVQWSAAEAVVAARVSNAILLFQVCRPKHLINHLRRQASNPMVGSPPTRRTHSARYCEPHYPTPQLPLAHGRCIACHLRAPSQRCTSSVAFSLCFTAGWRKADSGDQRQLVHPRALEMHRRIQGGDCPRPQVLHRLVHL